MSVKPFALIISISLGVSGVSLAEPPDVSIQIVGTSQSTSFPKLLLIHLANTMYTPFDLAGAIAASQLLIDGKLSAWTAAAFTGPAGLPSVSEWDGCIGFDDYAPPITPGTHKVSLKLASAQTEPISLHWVAPVNWRQGNLKTRSKEIHELAGVLKEGLPRSCVEHWLTVKDGGQQDENVIRYFLEPQFKIVVSYKQVYESNGVYAVINAPVKVYEEARLRD